MMVKIDLGCGKSKRQGFVGVDMLALEGVDIVHDLNIFPYPFKDNSVDEIYIDNVLEHLKNPLQVVEEVYRICKPNSIVTIEVPYFRSRYAFIDPTHINFFGVNWFNYFDPSHPFCQKYQYTNAHFRIIDIVFDKSWIESESTGTLHKLLIKYANKNLQRYEARLSHLFPLNSLTFNLQTIK